MNPADVVEVLKFPQAYVFLKPLGPLIKWTQSAAAFSLLPGEKVITDSSQAGVDHDITWLFHHETFGRQTERESAADADLIQLKVSAVAHGNFNGHNFLLFCREGNDVTGSRW